MKLRLIDQDAQQAADILARLEVLHLEDVNEADDALNEFPASEFQAIYNSIHSRYKKIIAYASVGDDKDALPGFEKVSLKTMETIDEKLYQLWLQVSQHEENQRQLKEQNSSVNHLMVTLSRFINLDIDLTRLGQKRRFLTVISGVLPSSNSSQLERALSINSYMMDVFSSSEGMHFVVIVGPAEKNGDMQHLLKSADFRELTIPEAFADHPHTVRQKLLEQQQAIQRSMAEATQQLHALIQEHAGLLQQARDLVYRAMPYAGVADHLKGKGRLVALQGWIPAARQQQIEAAFVDKLDYPYQLLFEQPGSDTVGRAPTSLRQNWLIMPFNHLIAQYGLPRYGEVDPAMWFALSYILMFGMMFGDIGHGAVILLASLLLVKRSSAMAVIGGLAGLSSMVFGFLYGSLFGYEHIIHPLWMSPMEDPLKMLELAFYWGVGFLLIANLLAIRNAWVSGEYQQALYSPVGVGGLLFYLSGLVYLLSEETANSWAGDIAGLFAIILLLVMLLYQWFRATGSVAERIMLVLVEGLEIVINAVSSTLSFLRVAAFSLNHVALASAVFALAAMLDSVGHVLAVVLGNIFIIVLEGAIVAIQCLRLEYYEGFSRFFSGRGKPYQPLKMDPFNSGR